MYGPSNGDYELGQTKRRTSLQRPVVVGRQLLLANNDKKGKGRYNDTPSPSYGTSLAYVITHSLPPDTSERALTNPSHTGCMVLDLPTPEG